MTDQHYDSAETRTPDQREAELFAALPGQLAYARTQCRRYGALLADLDVTAVTDRHALARLPLTRKSELIDLQQANPPFGGLNAVEIGEMSRVFASPGTIYDVEARGKDPWRTARALFASGLRAGDLVHNCFSYHFTPAGLMFETGAHALGCAVFPAGTGNTEQHVQVIKHLRPRAYVGTPDYLKVIIEKADALGSDVSSLRVGHVTGGALLPDAKAFYRDRDIAVFQSYGTADMGVIAYETVAREGLVVNEGVIVEIVRPGTGDPVSDGEVGEVVVTSFCPAYPLIRFATGDLSAILPGTSPCGRTNQRLRGWLGRADQTAKIKGMFVHPQQVAEVVRRHPVILRARLTITREGGMDVLTLRCEVAEGQETILNPVKESMQAVFKLRGGVTFVAPGSLPNDGKVIEDARPA